jgi:PAS domain S-box-containing protein
VPYVGYYYYVPAWDWYVIAADEEELIYAEANRTFRRALGIQALSGSAIALLLALIIASILRPIEALTRGVERIRRGELHGRIVVSSQDELHDLAAAFNSMAAELESTLVDLRENETRYRTLFNQARDAIYVVDPQTGRVVDTNDKAAEMTGYSPTELRQMVVADFYPPEYNIPTPPQPVLNKPRELHQRHQAGHLIPVEVNTTLISLAGQPFFLSYVRDLSLRRAAEQTLRRREAVLAAVSFAAEQLFKHPWEEVIGSVLAKFGEAAEMSRVTFFLNQATQPNSLEPFALHTEWVAPGVSELKPNPLYQNLEVEPSGLSQWAEPMSAGEYRFGLVRDLPPAQQALFQEGGVVAYAIFPIIVQGKFWGTLAFSDCVRERPWPAPELDALSTAARTLTAAIQRQQAEKELRWSEERFRLFGDNIDNVLWIIDTSGDIVYLSRAFEEIWGVKPEFVYENQPHWLNFVHPDDVERVREADENTVTHGFNITYRIMRPDGTVRWVRDRAFPLHDEQGVLFGEVGIAEDVTESLAAEEAMREVQRMESIGILAGGIAHDFNNLLTSMLGQASLVQYKLGEGHPARDNVFKVIKSAERAADLTRQLLAYAGKGNFQIEPLDLNDLIRENVGLLEVALPKQAHLHIHLAAVLAPVLADRGQMQQVVMNLVINAAESIHTDSGEVHITTALVTLSDEAHPRCVGNIQLPAGSYVCLRVQDTGMGMDGETQQRIFDPFFSTKQHGRGLGLSATLGIVHTHHGGVVLESEPGQGTMFTLYLPVSAENLPAASGQTTVVAPTGTGKVLVIDDEAPVREAVVDILEMMGVEVLTAANGRLGIEQYRQHTADISLVLLDMQMPELSGPETYLALHQINPEVRVVISSGYGEAEASRLFAVDGTLTFLQKPYSVERLMEIVWAELGRET